MSKFLKTTTTALSTTLLALYLSSTSALAQLKNPAISVELGAEADAAKDGTTFLSYFVLLWRALITVGGLLVIVYFVWGSIEWILAAGDAGKVQKARDRLTQSAIGLIVLVGSFAMIGLLSRLFFGDNFNLLELTVPTALVD